MAKSVVLRSRFGSRAKTLLERRELAAIDLAERSQISVQRVEKILDGSCVGVTLNDMHAIAEVLQMPLYVFLAPLELLGESERPWIGEADRDR
ncbi:MAG: helix-turn-helix transcriptional regulator [Actinobacteria bacterium]|nr:helix-turn-helix transcriptional regulator [Actinomycetota bacterium]